MNRQEKLYSMLFKDIYPLYLQKVLRKGRSESDLLICLCWLTGYSKEDIIELSQSDLTLSELFQEANMLNPQRHEITGSICGVKIQEIQDPLMKEIRYMDKVVDDLAKGKKSFLKILGLI